ncbi:conserved hypothetical protein [Tenacibaculum sp. 190524A02b]|uniref:DUF935 family protein n=1 Tax=Tenacibaculum vairaonense TaxID=3137860 RepID=A0ABM9PQX7_9FLAO
MSTELANMFPNLDTDTIDAKKASSVVLNLIRDSHSVYRKEINYWQMSRAERQSIEFSRTHLLQGAYKDAMLDTHLTAITNSRILRIINKKFVVKDKKGITNLEKSTETTFKKWFTDTLRYVLESIFYEYSLIQLVKNEQGEIRGVKLVPREHVNPDRRIVVKSVYDEYGLEFDKFPNDLLFAKMYDGYGLLEKAVPMTILKRHSWGSWDSFEQKFGLPIMIAKLGTMNKTVKKEVANWLQNMGKAAYGVFPKFADIDVKEPTNRDAFNIFMKKIETVDDQLSILVNGNTMTTKDGSSHSQAEVHQKTQDQIDEADLKNLLHWVNDVFVPVLRNHGCDISEEEYIGVEKITNPLEKIKTDEKIMQNADKYNYRLTKNYLETTYGVELEEFVPNKDNENTGK